MNWVRCGLLGVTSAVLLAAQVSVGLDLNDRGLAEFGRGNYAEAERLHNQAIQTWRAMGPDYQAHMAASLLNLGLDLSVEGKRREGMEAYAEALAIHRRTFGPKHIRTITNMNLVAGACLMQGDSDRAEALFAEALPVERELYPNHAELARTLAGIAALRQREGRFDEALPPAEEALSLVLKVEGEDSLDAALMYSNVGEIHRVAGRPERALPLYRKARAIYERNLGRTHPRVASLLCQEGLILANDGKLTLAELNITSALDMLAKSCPGCIADQAVAEHCLGLVRMKQKKYAAADQLLTHALALQEQAFVQPGPETADTLKSLALARQRERRYDDAALLQQRAATILAHH